MDARHFDGYDFAITPEKFPLDRINSVNWFRLYII